MAYHSVQAANIYSPYLTHHERSEYSRLMHHFMALCDAHNGSEQSDDACVNALILAEDFMKSVSNDHPDNIYSTDEIEQLFYRQALGQYLWRDETPPDYNQLLGRVAAKFNARVLGLGQAQDLENLFSILEQGGAVIVRNQNSVFVKTDPTRARINKSDGGADIDLDNSAPKFAEIITALQSIGIFANQMIIHPGTVDKDMVRTAPYHVIQIPELNCEIAVCDRIGEAIFVNRPLIGPHVFAMYDKMVLVGALGMKRVTYHGDWQIEMLGYVLGDAPADKAHRTRVDTQKFAKDQGGKPARLTPEMLMGVMLDYAHEQYEATKQWVLVTKNTTDPVPKVAGENWAGLSENGVKGRRGLEKGMTLSFIQQSYGVRVGQKINIEALEKAVKEWVEKGLLPQKIEIKSLSVERLLRAMLDYADEQFRATGQWLLPTLATLDHVPGMEGENWAALNANGGKGERGLEKGMTISVIQQSYGLRAGNKANTEALQKAVCDWKKKGILPQRIDVRPISVERILIAMLEDAHEQFRTTGQWRLSTSETLGAVPGMEGENWSGLNANGHKGERGLEKGMTLPMIQQCYGLKAGKKVNIKALQKAVCDWKEKEILPQKIEVKPLSIERVLIAMLDYADEQFKATGQWVLAKQYISDPVPGMEGETWLALDINGGRGRRGLEKGMTLAVIQECYGLKVGRKVNAEVLQKAVHEWKEFGRLPNRIDTMDSVSCDIHSALAP